MADAGGTADKVKGVLLPEECLSLYTEHVSGKELSGEVNRELCRDATYRMKELTHNAMHFMRHGKRQHMTTEDVNLALKWSSGEPVYGFSSCSTVPGLKEVGSGGVFVLNNETVPLPEQTAAGGSASLDQSTASKRPTLEGTWLCLEGQVVDKAAVNVSYDRNPVDAEERYLRLLTDAIQGDSEDIRRAAFVDIRTNGMVTAILPQLVQFTLNAVEKRLQLNSLQLHRSLRTLLAIAGNTNLYLEPYVAKVVEGMLTVILEPVGFDHFERVTHFHVRELAAACLAEFIKKAMTSRLVLLSTVTARLSQQLGLVLPSFGPLYGAIMAFCYLGRQTVVKAVLPNLDGLYSQVKSTLESTAEAEIRSGAMKVHEALLTSAEIMLLCGSEDQSGTARDEPVGVSMAFPEAQQEQRPPTMAPEPMDTGQEWSVMVERQLPATTDAELYQKLAGIYGEELLCRLVPLDHRSTPSRSARKEEASSTMGNKTDGEGRPSGSESSIKHGTDGEEENGEEENVGGFKPFAHRVKVQQVQPGYGYRPVICFSVAQRGRVRPWNILDPDTCEMYVKQQHMYRQHLRQQGGGQRVMRGRVKERACSSGGGNGEEAGSSKVQDDKGLKGKGKKVISSSLLREEGELRNAWL